jgi:hypothetical protein
MNSNEEQLAFFEQVGRAVTQWATVEQALLDIVSACFDDRYPAQLTVSYWAVENFRSKLQMVHNLVAVKFGQSPHFDQWNALRDRVDRESRARNTLSHYWLLTHHDGRPGRCLGLHPRPTRLARAKTVRRTQKVPPGTLFVRDIAYLARRFSALTCEIHNFGAILRGRPVRYQESFTQIGKPPTLADLVHEIRALSGRRA